MTRFESRTFVANLPRLAPPRLAPSKRTLASPLMVTTLAFLLTHTPAPLKAQSVDEKSTESSQRSDSTPALADHSINVAASNPSAELKKAETLAALYRKRLRLAEEIRDHELQQQEQLKENFQRLEQAQLRSIEASKDQLTAYRKKLEEMRESESVSPSEITQLERVCEAMTSQLTQKQASLEQLQAEHNQKLRNGNIAIKTSGLDVDEAQTVLQLAEQAIAELSKRALSESAVTATVQTDDPKASELLVAQLQSGINLNAEDAAAELEKAKLLAASYEERLQIVRGIHEGSENTLAQAQKLFEQAIISKTEVDSARRELMESKLGINSVETQLALAKAAIKHLEVRVKQAADAQNSTSRSKQASSKKSTQPPKQDPLEPTGLSKEDLKDCELHIIGLYRASREDNDDQIYVDIKPTGKPIVAVVSAYSEALWRIRMDSKANVKLVIVAGYFAQDATLIDSDVPMINLTYFQSDREPRNVSRGPWAYAYSWNTDEGRKMARMLYDLTGLTASTFQGIESARYMVIDGKRGKLTNRQAKEPIPGLLTEAERQAEPVRFPESEPDEPGKQRKPSMSEVDFEGQR